MKTTKDYTLHIICGMILFAALFSCNSNIPKEQSGIEINGRKLEYYTIEGCEYIGNVYGGNGDFMTHSGRCKNHGNKYTLIQSDSPHLPNYHPEIDLISNDTIYVNWYSNDKK